MALPRVFIQTQDFDLSTEMAALRAGRHRPVARITRASMALNRK